MKIDEDLKTMTASELRREVMKLRNGMRKELRHTGNHRCWLNLLMSLPEGEKLQPLDMIREEFLKNCGRYFDRNQGEKK